MDLGLHNRFIVGVSEYLTNIYRSVTTIFTGLHITASHLFREPMTIQYPDRMAKPVKEALPDRYRGFLKVDLEICTGCKLCEKDCPIDCIEIVIEKNEETKERTMTVFDIDLAKCMWCGLCTEPCPTGSIYFTPEFEKATTDLRDLLFRFIKQGDKVPLYKVPRKKKEPAPKPAQNAEAEASSQPKPDGEAK